MKCLRVFSRPDQHHLSRRPIGRLAWVARGRQFSIDSGQSPLSPREEGGESFWLVGTNPLALAWLASLAVVEFSVDSGQSLSRRRERVGEEGGRELLVGGNQPPRPRLARALPRTDELRSSGGRHGSRLIEAKTDGAKTLVVWLVARFARGRQLSVVSCLDNLSP